MSMDGNICQMEAIVTAWELKIIWYGDTFQISNNPCNLCNWSPRANGLNSYNRSDQGPILYVDDTDVILIAKCLIPQLVTTGSIVPPLRCTSMIIGDIMYNRAIYAGSVI